MQLLQNLGHDGDDESENSLKVSKEEREAYLAERAEKKKAQKRAYNVEYNKRREVVARRKEPEVVARRKASNDEYKKKKRQCDTVAKSDYFHDFDEVLQVCSLYLNQYNFCNYCRIWETMGIMSLKLASRLARRKVRKRLTLQKKLQKEKRENGLIALNIESDLRLLQGVRPLRPKEQKKRKQKMRLKELKRIKHQMGLIMLIQCLKAPSLAKTALTLKRYHKSVNYY